MHKILLSWVVIYLFSVTSYAVSETKNIFRYPYYIGVAGGFGSTTWDGLVPSAKNRNMAMNISTPTTVDEGGAVFGFLAGYEFTQFFALEANYMHYPTAKVTFDENSLFTFENNGRTHFMTHTETASLMAKVMLVIPRTPLRMYSSAGVARVNRWDETTEQWRVAPTFGLGFNTNFTEHMMGEFGLNYTAGYGESELNPSKDYVPFLYSAAVRVAYRF